MATLADSLISSSSRSITLRMRPDLSARRHRYQGRTYWVLKEPVGLNYFRFHEEEYEILNMLDGRSSLEDIKEQFESQFAPQKITFQDLQQFIGMLHRSGLVISHASGQGVQLKKRRDEKKRRELLGKLSNVFAFRWRGIDPEWILNRIYPWTGWFFSVPMILFVLLFGLSALTLVTTQYDEFESRLPTFHQFFGPHNWIYLGITMAIVKVLHEFGHGLSCKRYGGECHEMGFMLLVFTPALYCNVSDSWMLPNKWHRVFIGAAGMYVEIFLATCATWIWWFSYPGTLINALSLSVMFICSVSTVMFNGNPLLRFDGYYILMDVLEIPNLRQKATEVLRRFMVNLCLGIEQPENPFLPQTNRFWFGLYTVAAVFYRWVVVFSIVMFLNKALEPYGLKIIGRLMAVTGLFGLVIQPLWQLGKFFWVPGRMHKVKKYRVVGTLSVVAAVIFVVGWIPLPYHVDCTMRLVPFEAESVYPTVPGVLAEIPTDIKPGVEVREGTVLGRLENVDLEISVTRLKAERDEAESQLKSLEYRRHDERELSVQINRVKRRLETTDKQLKEKQAQLNRLQLTANTTGVIISPEYRPAPPSPDGRLSFWSGSPFEKKNERALMTEQDLFCEIGDPHRLSAELFIDQNDIELVKRDNEVHVLLDAFPNRVFKTQVARIAVADLKVTPRGMSSQAGGELNSEIDPTTGASRPINTSYQSQTEVVGDPEQMLRIGWRGRAKVFTGWQTIFQRVSRFVARTFHFEL